MMRVRVTMELDYDPDLTGHVAWGTFAAIFAAQARMKLVRTEVELNPPPFTEIKVSQQPAPGTGASFT